MQISPVSWVCPKTQTFFKKNDTALKLFYILVNKTHCENSLWTLERGCGHVVHALGTLWVANIDHSASMSCGDLIMRNARLLVGLGDPRFLDLPTNISYLPGGRSPTPNRMAGKAAA